MSQQKDYRVTFKTLGCKLNQSETEAMATGFKRLGWQIGEFGQPSDAVVVNSCTVTNAADRKSRSAMNQALKTPGDHVKALDSVKNKRAKPLVVMTGCHADGHRKELEADGRVYVVGNNHKSRIPQLVDAHFRGELLPGHLEDDRDPFGYPVPERIFRTRAMIKIQDGCDNFCSFCIIPFVRGRGLSRSFEESLKALEEAAASGYKEIILTGVNMSRWSDGNRKFVDLVDACLNVPGDFRLRLGSIEPDGIGSRLIDLMGHPKMTPHMHLCLQSGSDKVLLAMRRQYTVAEFCFIADSLRRNSSGFNLSTDVIVGFPTESEKDFSDTLKICKQLKFSHIHTFPYSRRDGTRADRMDVHIPKSVKDYRSGEIRALSQRLKRDFRQSMLGSIQEVLVEDAHLDGCNLRARGLSANYVPVRFELPKNRKPDQVHNHIFQVRIDGVDAGDDPDLLGSIEPVLD